MTHAQRTLLAIGGYTPGDEPAESGPAGLTTWWWDGSTGLEPAGEANLASPSFACWHPRLPVLYAVSELDKGVLTVMSVSDDGSLDVTDTCPTGGAQPCWVTTDPTGTALLIANYDVAGTASSMTVIGLDAAGRPQSDPVVVVHSGSGPVADRQASAHVHQVVPTAEGTVLASDLGADRLTEYRIDRDPETAALTASEMDRCAMPPGSGPRHIALAAGGATGFVTSELDATVTVIRRDSGAWRAVGQVPSTALTDVETARVYPSQILLSPTNRWLLLANRGPTTIAVLDVADELRIVDEQQVRSWPRHFTIAGNRLLVACQYTNEVELLSLDDATGRLTSEGVLVGPDGTSPLRAPSCVALRGGL